MFVFAVLVGVLLAAAIARPNIPQAQKFEGELEFPSVKEGRPIPVIFGTVDLKAPNVVWWGDWEQRSIKKDGERIGYSQWAGVHMVFCHGPVDKILGIYGDKDKVIWEGSITSNQTIYVDNNSLYGHRKTGEGGVKGNVAIQFGYPNQSKNAYLVQQQGITSAHRGLFALVLEKCWLGNTKTPKPWWVRAQRIHTRGNGATQWYDEKAQIGTYDMNPAHIVREALLDTEWGAGELESSFAPGNFEAMADLYYDEGMGLSMSWDQKGDVYKFIESVLQQCNSVLYQDPQDGYLYLKAIRDDYVKENLPVISRMDGAIIEMKKVARPSVSEQVNTMTAEYRDRERGEPATFTLQDQAAVELYGVIADTIKYPGIRDPDIVAEALARDLAVASRSLRTCNLVCNRDAANITLGDPFVLDDFMFDLDMVVMRVTEISYGDGHRSSVTITCIEDAFSAPPPFKVVPPSNWVQPQTQPQEITTGELTILPRYLAELGLGANWATVDTSSEVVYALLAEMPVAGMADFDVLFDTDGNGTWETEAGSGGFAATFTLGENIGIGDTNIPVGVFNLASKITAGDFALLEDEWLEIVALNADSVDVKRAVFDTVPAAHAQGALAFVVNPNDDDFPLLANPVSNSVTVSAKPLVIASGGQLEDATPISGPAPYARLARPLPPGNFSIDGNLLPDSTTYHAGDINLAWSKRDNSNAASATAGWFSATDYASTATHYVEVWNADKTVQGSTLTGSSVATYSQAQELTDFGALQGALTFVLYSEENGEQSLPFEWVSYRLPAELTQEVAPTTAPSTLIFDGTGGVEVTE